MMLATKEKPDTHAATDAVARMIVEGLLAAVSTDVAAQVIATAGPRGASDAETARWLDKKLFPALVARIGLAEADEVRTQIHAMLQHERRHVASSHVSLKPARRNTMTPASGRKTVLVWSDDLDAMGAIAATLSGAVTVFHARSAIRFLAALAKRSGDRPLVVIDQRKPNPEALRTLSSDSLEGYRVVVWGPATLSTPELTRVLCEAERAVGCTTEADAIDIAALCMAILGRSE
jgi:hypothetical protein